MAEMDFLVHSFDLSYHHYFLYFINVVWNYLLLIVFRLVRSLQGGILKFQYVSNYALSSGAICLKILPFDCLSLCHLDVEKLRYRDKSDSTFVVSVEKGASNKERTSILF